MRAAHREWAEKRAEVDRIRALHDQGNARREELEAIVGELEALGNLKAGRRAALDAEIKRISNFERLLHASERAIALLAGDDGLAARMKEIGHALHDVARIDPAATHLVSEFETGRQMLADSEISLRRYVQSLEFDESELENLREELSEIARLERKHKTDDAGLVALRDRSKQELQSLINLSSAADTERELQQLLARVKEVAAKLHQARASAARELAAAVSQDLKELNMTHASFEVRFVEVEPSASGTDKAEFLISTNKAEPCAPLIQIASGGELSRVMLVLKKILRERSGVNVLIFDEVDSGISGGVARSVGIMLKEISAQSQVVCITHLPQVASLSDRHFLVNKEVGERAVTVVKQLSDDEKVDEIARMLAGYKITEASRASARELIAGKS
jgi:DNA repair protein RecN (Recombination protein N)